MADEDERDVEKRPKDEQRDKKDRKNKTVGMLESIKRNCLNR